MKFPRVICFLLIIIACASAVDWEVLSKVLDSSIEKHAAPGFVAAAFTKDKIFYLGTRGFFTYGIPPPLTPGVNPPMQRNTLFDMASCTKVMAGTSATALLYQKGLLDLNAKVSQYLPGFESNGKAEVKVLNLLLHNTGFPPDPSPGYPSVKFGCPETSNYYPNLTFSCRDKCYNALLSQTLQDPIGEKYVYSDINLMTIMNIVGAIAQKSGLITDFDIRSDCPLHLAGVQQCYYEAFVRKYVFAPLKMTHTMYLPPDSLKKTIAPTENDTTYRHQIVQGVVHDENTYAMGGISGHAGLFTTIDDAIALTRAWLYAPDSSTLFLNSTTVKLFTTVHNLTQSSRALGWDTNVATPETSCGSLSAKTFLHNGFTGVQICADPVRGFGTVLLSNRVYPKRTEGGTAPYEARKAFATTSQQLFDSQ